VKRKKERRRGGDYEGGVEKKKSEIRNKEEEFDQVERVESCRSQVVMSRSKWRARKGSLRAGVAPAEEKTRSDGTGAGPVFLLVLLGKQKKKVSQVWYRR
jgi:hypothetical protein